MTSNEGYDVLRLIEHGKTCYISSEYVEGSSFPRWLKYHPNMSKERLFECLQSIAKQLAQIHRCRSKPCYQYVNPYSIIVTEEGELYFLDPEASSNDEIRRKMQRRDIREHFLPPENPYYHKGSTRTDLYGLGRTYQYILANVTAEPALTKREEARLHKTISKCLKRDSKGSCQSMAEVRRHLPVYQPPKERKISGKRRILAAAALLIVIVSLCKSILPQSRDSRTEDRQQKTGAAIEEKVSVEKDNETVKVYLDVILSYFLDLKDYEKCLIYLDKIQDQHSTAKQIRTVVERYADGEKKVSDQTLKEALETLREELPLEVSSKEEIYYLRFLVKGYVALEGEEEMEVLIELGNACLETGQLDLEEEKEILEDTAFALEKSGREEESADQYAKLLELETESQKKEELYKRIITLYESCELKEQAVEVCVQGIEELQESGELRVMHIRLLCSDESVDRGVCAQTIQEYLRQIPEIRAGEEFQKIQKEYEIQVEGEEVWVGS